MKKTQHRGSDKKPRVLESGTAKTNSAESSHSSVSDARRPLVKVGDPCSYGWNDIWLTKSLFPYELSFLVFSNTLQTSKWQWVSQGVPKALLSAMS